MSCDQTVFRAFVVPPSGGIGIERRLKAGLRTNRSAFTLLELLLATAVGAIVLLVINATFFSALRLNTATHEKIDHDLVIQRALRIIRKDFAGIMLPAAVPAANAQTIPNTLSGQLSTEINTTNELDNSGERITPDITTSSGTIDGWTPYAEVQMVSYYLTPSEDGGRTKNLVRLVTRNLLSAVEPVAESRTLLPGVVSAAISYFDGQYWVDTWDTTVTSTLPTAIKLSLVLAPRDNSGTRSDPAPIETIVPVLVATPTSAQQAADAAAAAGT